jgi:hypothetical protein
VTHFGIAFGTIVVTVIGGALVLDHFTSTEKVAARPATTTTQAQAELPAANVAKESAVERPVTLADATPSAPSGARVQEAAPSRTQAAPKKTTAASTSTRSGTSASTATLAASTEEAQSASSERTPAPAPAPVDTPAATPKGSDEPQEGPKPS